MHTPTVLSLEHETQVIKTNILSIGNNNNEEVSSISKPTLSIVIHAYICKISNIHIQLAFEANYKHNDEELNHQGRIT